MLPQPVYFDVSRYRAKSASIAFGPLVFRPNRPYVIVNAYAGRDDRRSRQRNARMVGDVALSGALVRTMTPIPLERLR